jgi:hypothetical protein
MTDKFNAGIKFPFIGNKTRVSMEEFAGSSAKSTVAEKMAFQKWEKLCNYPPLVIDNGRMCQKLSAKLIDFLVIRKCALLKNRKRPGWFGKFGSGSERTGSGLDFPCTSLEKMIQPVPLYQKASVLCPRRGKNCTTKMIKSKNRLPIDERERRNGVVSSGMSRSLDKLKRRIPLLIEKYMCASLSGLKAVTDASGVAGELPNRDSWQ